MFPQFQLALMLLVVCIGLMAGPGRSVAQEAYDPLRRPRATESASVEPTDLAIRDTRRNREMPVRVYLPFDKTPAPVVIFSHGLGGSREAAGYLGRHWAARGYVAVFIQHPGSDEAVWRETPLRQRLQTLQDAANVRNFKDRVDDVSIAIDWLEEMSAAQQGLLAGRLDVNRLGMSGHSFGAVTTQAVSGQRQPIGVSTTDTRIKAAVIMSPSPPRNQRLPPERAFGDVRIPWMLMTGTKDGSPLGDQTPQARLTVFPALPAGDKFELVLKDGEHHAFTEERSSRAAAARNPQHHTTVLALSTAFWDAYLKDDAAAKRWLTSQSVQAVLSPGDRWQTK